MSGYWETLQENVVLLIFLMPLVGAGLTVLSARMGVDAVRRTALTNAILTFSLVMLMVAHYEPSRVTPSGKPELVQMTSTMKWLQEERFRIEQHETEAGEKTETLVAYPHGPNVQLAVGVDGISLWFIVLTATLTIPAILAGRVKERDHPALYYSSLLVLQSALIGLFSALDVIFFLICLEFISLPMFLLIGRWGGYERRHAVGRFVLFHLAGTLLVMFALLALVQVHTQLRAGNGSGDKSPTFAVHELIDGTQPHQLSNNIPGIRDLISQNPMARMYWEGASFWIFGALLVGFAIHAAMVPFHAWLSTTNDQSPTSASLMITGVLLVTGCFGMARFVVPLFPPKSMSDAAFIPMVGILGSIYAALLALTEDDMKKLVTFACISQLCLSIAGLFSFHSSGVTGALLLLVSTGLSMGVLLFLIGALETRTKTRAISALGGLQQRSPRLCTCFFIATLALIGVPGLSGFVSQFLTLLGLYAGNPFLSGSPLVAVGGMIGSLLVACSLVRLIQSCLRGPLREPASTVNRNKSGESPFYRHTTSDDLALHETAAMILCLVLMVSIGVYPRFFISSMEPSVEMTVYGHLLRDDEKSIGVGGEGKRMLPVRRNSKTFTREPETSAFPQNPRDATRGFLETKTEIGIW